MLLAQQAELKKLTAEVGALKGALATRPVAAAPVARAPAAPPRASKATYASRVAQPAPAAPAAVPRVPATATPRPRHDEGRLILKVTPSPAISCVVRNATAARSAINTALARLPSQALLVTASDPSLPLPSSQVLQAEVEDYVQHCFSWAAPPIWLTPAGRVAEEGSGSVLLSFSREEDLEYVLRNGVFLFGRALRSGALGARLLPSPSLRLVFWGSSDF
ncbi:hypothetical protein AURDEDRAFT_175876 [Auricularia subglabra TFB-10046 SS5]|nr:hypothetical protein AURDEDRAFT_175876 [Auricularia subglabra TFB-10046 SS5]